MRRFAFPLAILLAAILGPAQSKAWAPDFFSKRDWSESQALSRTGPTTDATLGMDLSNVVAFQVVITAAASQTLSGGGTIDFWTFDSAVGSSWFKGSFQTPWTLTACAGLGTCSSTVYEARLSRGRVLPVTNAVTVSGGTTVTVRIIATISGKSVSQ